MSHKLLLFRTVIPCLLVILFLNGSSRVVSTINRIDGECIIPAQTFAYAANPQQEQDEHVNRFPGYALPPMPWKRERALPDQEEYSDLIAIRAVPGGTEIWTLMGYSEFNVYHVETKTWRKVPAQVEGTDIPLDKLLVTQDGSLWGLLSKGWRDETKPGFALSKYDEKKARFEYVEGTQGIPAFFVDSYGSTYWPRVILDQQQNVFWFLMPENGIYSYDPTTQKSQYHTDLPDMDVFDLVNDPVFSPDGNIYYLAIKPITVTNRDIRFYKFSPTTYEIEYRLLGLQPSPVVGDIYADRSGRLWFGGVGWREPDDTWYHMFPSPIFLKNILWSGMEYRWQSPEILLESSDNRLWFRSENGLAWMDKEKEKWCWFTIYGSNIVEDQNHNLWMIADGFLYKYALKRWFD